MADVSPARLVAVETLLTVEHEVLAQAAEVLNRVATREGLREDDLRLARTLVFGVLRHALTLDYYYGQHLKKPASKLEVPLRILLRVAMFQKHFLDKVPDYAIVHETVELGKRRLRLQPRQAGFLNAVLRKVAASPNPRALPEGNRVNDLAIRYSFTPYLAGLFVAKYGTHKAVAIMKACNQEPPLTIRLNTLLTNGEKLVAELATAGHLLEPARLAPESYIVKPEAGARSLFETDAFSAGHFYVQDEGSQAVAHILAPKARERILDLCSAPGGKTTHLAELSNGNAHITATDFSDQRLKLVEENIARLRTPNVAVLPLKEVLEGRTGSYDAVLVDAPCSGMGTIRRNPEIRYRITAESLARQASRQLEVLESAAGLVRPGGRLVYSTCSMSDMENKNLIQAFLRAHPEYTVSKSTPGAAVAINDLRRDDGWYATWPDYPLIDGFEAVVLERAVEV